MVGPEYISCLYWTGLCFIIYMYNTWLKCALWGISIASYAVSVYVYIYVYYACPVVQITLELT